MCQALSRAHGETPHTRRGLAKRSGVQAPLWHPAGVSPTTEHRCEARMGTFMEGRLSTWPPSACSPVTSEAEMVESMSLSWPLSARSTENPVLP